VRLPKLKPAAARDGKIHGRIIHIDRFGNCITNLTQRELTSEMIAAGAVLHVKGKRIKSFRSFFADDGAGKDKLFGVWGSAGFLEIASTNDSAARILKAKRGDAVTVKKGNRGRG